ncbi:MAG: hypothetical protein Q9164_006146 [Protoblastenia rupestris]
MTTLERQKSIFDEVLAPHLTSEEGQAFLAGQARLDQVQNLRALISAHNEVLAQLDFYPTHIAPFLDIEICGPEDEARAKGMLCQAFGLVTQRGSADAQGMMEKGTRLMKNVEERFRSQPEKYEHFMRTALSGWREGEGDGGVKNKNEVRRELIELLEGEEDLWERAKEIWPINVEGGSGTLDTSKA